MWYTRIGIPQIIRDILAAIGIVQTTADDIETKVDTSITDIGAVQTTENNIETKVDTIITDVGAVQTTVDNIETKTDTVITDVGAVQTTVDNVETKVDTAITDIAAVQVTADAGVAETVLHDEHFHSREHWFGTGASRTTFTPYEVDSGTSGAYGTWVELLGTGVTPVEVGKVEYDPHRITIEDIETNQKLIRLQLFAGANGDAPSAQDATNVTTTILRVDTGDKGANPVEIRNARIAVGTALQCRIAMEGQTTKFIKFFLGIHEYDA